MSEKQEHTTTKEQFEAFKNEARYWQSKFGQLQWVVVFHHRDLDDGGGALAQCRCNTEQSMAQLILTKPQCEEPFSGEEIAMSAFHEVMEMMLWELTSPLAEIRGAEWMNRETHRVIRTLENAVWRPDWEARQ